MKRLASAVFLLLLAACSRPADTTQNAAPPEAAAPAVSGPATGGWMVTDGIKTPESVWVDPATGFVYTSQVDGAPDARDGNGRIVKLTGDGRVISTTWAAGLSAPKGLRGCNGTLWVADLDEVIGISLATGAESARVKIPGAKFLNDVECATDGTVYVADTVASSIYSVKDGRAQLFADGEDLEYPNGLLLEGDHLVVGGWGKPEADFSTKVPGRLYALDLKTRQQTLITPMPFANIDGVESDGGGGYIVSDFNAGTLLHVNAKGESRLLQQFKPGAADIGYAAKTHIVIVPHMNENTVASYDISSALK